jgi:hypothetical protein
MVFTWIACLLHGNGMRSCAVAAMLRPAHAVFMARSGNKEKHEEDKNWPGWLRNVGLYAQSLACTGAADADPTGGLTVAVGDVAIVCAFTNAIHRADLVLTKTNTPGANAEQDQASDTVVPGAATACEITVTNNGPHAADGAVLHDRVLHRERRRGLSCRYRPGTARRTAVASLRASCRANHAC